MYFITKGYVLKWQVKNANHIQVATDKTVINTRTNRVIKEKTNGGSYGYWIGKKFIITSKMNQHVEKIPFYEVPF